MKDFALKLIEPKVFITILVSGLVIYGIYKGIINYNEIWFLIKTTISKATTTISITN